MLGLPCLLGMGSEGLWALRADRGEDMGLSHTWCEGGSPSLWGVCPPCPLMLAFVGVPVLCRVLT